MRNAIERRLRPAARWLPPMLTAFGVAACTAAPAPSTTMSASAGAVDTIAEPIVWTVEQVPTPPNGGIAQQDPVTMRHMATRIMRIAPGARLPEHYHGGYDETFVVQAGQLNLMLDGRAQSARAGSVLIIPAGTTITGDNPGPAESVVVVVWANTGRGGPLTTPGRSPRLTP